MFSAKWNASLFGLMLMLSTPAAHGQQANKFTAACSYRDLLVTTLIDRHGEDQDIAGDKLGEAYFVVMDARVACARGREREALAMYDSLLRIAVPARAIATR
jgi:hypothetical protein